MLYLHLNYMFFIRTMSIVFAFWRAIGAGNAPNLGNTLLGNALPINGLLTR